MDKGVPEARQGAKNVEVRIKLEHLGLHVNILVNALETLAQTEAL